MSKFHTTGLRSVKTVSLVAVMVMVFSSPLIAADDDKAALEEQLAEAQRLLEADLANQKETEEKRQAIEDRLAAQKAREQEILEELKQLCEEQETISPGTMLSCMAKLNN